MSGYDPRRAPTSAAMAHHDVEVQVALAEETARAEDRGYIDRAYLFAAQADNGDGATAEQGQELWKWLPTSHKFRHLQRARAEATEELM